MKCIQNECICETGYCYKPAFLGVGFECAPEVEASTTTTTTTTTSFAVVHHHCKRKTGITCVSVGAADPCNVRGRADCVDNECVCKPGFCNEQLLRIVDACTLCEEFTGDTCMPWATTCGISGKSECRNGKCYCKPGYCAKRSMFGLGGSCEPFEPVGLSAFLDANTSGLESSTASSLSSIVAAMSAPANYCEVLSLMCVVLLFGALVAVLINRRWRRRATASVGDRTVRAPLLIERSRSEQDDRRWQ
eukprot:TRINITY_DN24473_c0_g2_i1.p1 TRINITY_DN24473_c0_g2~~TRINITY_DN24473_c0_g2_i1.p1  ORF type:complete len:270 (+),score=24.11 TRINITY_DN24473_c0_g2_i1:67-810(+)